MGEHRSPAAPERLGPTLGFMRALWELDHALFSASKRMKARLGVTGPERLVIRIVGEFPGVSPGEVAALMHLDPSTLTGALQRLVRRRLLARRVDPADARRSTLRLTAAGAALDRLRTGTVEEGVRATLAELAPRDVATTLDVVAALARTLGRLDAAAARGVRRGRTGRPRRRRAHPRGLPSR